jgi:serine O-acetyltransferase
VGIGASVIQNIHIGHEAIVGAGSVIIRDVPAETMVAGVPAQVIRPAPTVSPQELVDMLAPDHLRPEAEPSTTRPGR